MITTMTAPDGNKCKGSYAGQLYEGYCFRMFNTTFINLSVNCGGHCDWWTLTNRYMFRVVLVDTFLIETVIFMSHTLTKQ